MTPEYIVADQYVVAFLNSEGGRIFWGITDVERKAVCVRLNDQEKDEIRRVVGEKLNNIQPPIAPSDCRIEVHQIIDGNVKAIQNIYVVEITVSKPKADKFYDTSKGEAWIKTDGGKKQLEEEILKQRGF